MVISANEDVKAVAPEVIRRTVICRVSAGLTNTEVMKSNAVRTTQQKIGTAFYREYLRRMLECVPTLIEEMKDDEIEMSPDLLSYSSKILYEIFKEFGDEIPEYIRELSLEDYFSEQVTGQNTITIIQNAWRVNKRAFKIDKRNNELRYYSGQTYDAERFMKELPETLEARRSKESGVSAELVSIWAGHSLSGTITTTVYTHYSEEFQLKEAEKVDYLVHEF